MQKTDNNKFSLPQEVYDLLMSLSLDGTIHIDNFSDDPRWMVTTECDAKLDRIDEDNFKIKIIVDIGKANMTIETLREKLIPKSYYPYFSKIDFESYKRIWEVSVIKTMDQMDTVRRSLAKPITSNLTVERVIEIIHAWNALYTIHIIGVGEKWLTVSLEKLPNDITKFVKNEVFRLCPHFANLSKEEYYPNFSAVDKFRTSLYYHRIVELNWK